MELQSIVLPTVPKWGSNLEIYASRTTCLKTAITIFYFNLVAVVLSILNIAKKEVPLLSGRH